MTFTEMIFVTLLTAPMLAVVLWAVLWAIDRIRIRNIGRIVLIVVVGYIAMNLFFGVGSEVTGGSGSLVMEGPQPPP